jgi:putative transferase (TIGR04331 family)
MNDIPRYLVTTADERTWKFDRPVLFLGEWCRLYDRKNIWQDMDAIVAEPYGMGFTKKNSDHARARALEDKLFHEFCILLNQHHDSRHGERFWRIVLGHWFQRIIGVLLNRVNTLEQAFHLYTISGTSIYAIVDYSLAPLDSYSAIWAFNDDRWNNILTGRILSLYNSVEFPIERISGEDLVDNLLGFRFKPLVDKQPFKKKILKWGYQVVGKIARIFVRDKDALIINSYLPKKDEIQLQLALKQYPQVWTSPKFEVLEKPDKALRESLTNKISIESGDNLEKIVSSLLFELLPVCYLEGFTELNNVAKSQPWPNSPKFIFTSNDFDTNEVFKLWAATKVESGFKYFVGQHGNYGVSRNHLEPSNEEITADKFLTWGWVDGLPQHTPAFGFKVLGRKLKQYDPQGGLLLVELCLNHRITTWDNTCEYVQYFSNQTEFVRHLDSAPKQNLIIRLPGIYPYLTGGEESRWDAFDPMLSIEKGRMPIKDLIADSRLVVHSYDSTGILETLALNIPTLAFWQNGFDHLRESAKPYYQLLVDAGIVHFSAESVANKVNEVWEDIDGWWGQAKIQEVRKQFCGRYARKTEIPVRELRKIFTDQSSA